MKYATSLWLMVAVGLAASCASQPPPAEPRRASQPPAAESSRREAPAPKLDSKTLAEVLKAVQLEPVQAGKNVRVPMDAGNSTPTGPVTCSSACKRIVGTCLVETIQATGKISPQQIDRYRKSGMLAKIRAMATKSCQKACAKPGTKNHAKMQAMKHCAKKTTCLEVGSCAAKHIK